MNKDSKIERLTERVAVLEMAVQYAMREVASFQNGDFDNLRPELETLRVVLKTANEYQQDRA